MNKAITSGLALAPTPFSDVLDDYSKRDGTADSPSYNGAPTAASVPADQQSGGAL